MSAPIQYVYEKIIYEIHDFGKLYSFFLFPYSVSFVILNIIGLPLSCGTGKGQDMNFGFLGAFITFALLISFNAKRYSRKERRDEKDFWARESQANSVRRKTLDRLRYVIVPLEQLPTHILNDNPRVLECIETVETLASQKIVNFTGWTNTDLKLEYGAANITILSEYDQNYTLLVRTLQKWADELIAAGYQKEASVIMEFAVSTNTDISSTYYQLADYWLSQGQRSRIEELIHTAEGLRSSSRNTILRHLKEKYQQP